eukprot:TRINITY_DN27173_c0_g1_i1.p1 TRINITY_DN27173_c0_g1~~TRINITY_DN27173_c0_g1_i1.p1  ORF type:complete len:142 (-),score=13.97 TRINITY_DN27173_c0_g1_i1:116-541(-)
MAQKEQELEKQKPDRRASRLLHSLQNANYQLMRLNNLLDMRGILEFVEQAYKAETGTRPAPQVIWEGVLINRKSLAACISKKTGWPMNTTKIASRICSLKDTQQAQSLGVHASRAGVTQNHHHHERASSFAAGLPCSCLYI